MDFAFLIHSRDYTDVQRKFKIAKFLPKSWVEFWCLHWPPVVTSKIVITIDNVLKFVIKFVIDPEVKYPHLKNQKGEKNYE